MSMKRFLPIIAVVALLVLAPAVIAAQPTTTTTEPSQSAIGYATLNINRTVSEVRDLLENLSSRISVGRASVHVGGTEYVIGDDAKVWLQLLDGSSAPMNNMACFSRIYFPNGTVFIDYVLLQYLAGSDGIYFHDFTAPDAEGVYMVSTYCRVPQTMFVEEFSSFNDTVSYGNVTIVGGKLELVQYNQSYSTGAKMPSSYGDDYAQWTNPVWAIGSDNDRATTSVNGEKNDWYNFNLNVPVGASITGITAYLEGSTATGTTGVDVELSWNGGSGYTSTSHGYTTSSLTDTIRALGSASDLWGRNWTSDELNNTNFRIRLNKKGDAGVNHRIDNIEVNVSYNMSYGGTSGYSISRNITLNGTAWSRFYVSYSNQSGTGVSFSILNYTNATLCSGIDNGANISGCAGSSNAIKVMINLTGNGTASPAVDRYWLDYTVSEFQEIHGSGEVHISRSRECNNTYYNLLNVSIQNTTVENTYNNTQMLNVTVENVTNNQTTTVFGNVTFPAGVNITDSSMDAIGDEVIIKILQNARILNDRVVNFHNSQYCISNETLQHNITYTYCAGMGNCRLMVDIMNETCTYGCDYESQTCSTPEYQVRLLVLIGLVLLLVVLVVILRRLGRI
jgi:hypothetical protein